MVIKINKNRIFRLFIIIKIRRRKHVLKKIEICMKVISD